MRRLNKFANASLWSVGGTALSRLIFLYSMIMVAGHISADNYGLIGLIFLSTNVFTLVSVSALGMCLRKYLSPFIHSDPTKANRTINNLYLVLLVTTAILVFCILIMPELSGKYLFDKAYNKELLLIFCATLVLANIKNIHESILVGIQAFKTLSIIKVLESMYFILHLHLVSHSLTFEDVIQAFILSQALFLLISLLYLMSFYRLSKFTYRITHFTDSIKIVRDFGLPSYVAAGASSLALWFVALTLKNANGGLADLGVYTVANQMYAPLIFVPLIISSVALPMLSQYFSNGDVVKFRKTCFQLIGWSFLITFCLGVVVMLGLDHIALLFDVTYTGFKATAEVLLFAAPLHVFSSNVTSVLQSVGKPNWHLCIALLSAFSLYVSFSSNLVGSGSVGLAKAILLSYLVYSVIGCFCLSHIFKSRGI